MITILILRNSVNATIFPHFWRLVHIYSPEASDGHQRVPTVPTFGVMLKLLSVNHEEAQHDH